MASVSFAKTTVDLGEIKWRSTNHRCEFPFTGDDANIEDIYPLCGCAGDYYIEHNSVILLYNNISKEENFVNGEASIDVRIQIFFKDGKPLKVKNERGNLVYNAEKAHAYLRIIAKAKK